MIFILKNIENGENKKTKTKSDAEYKHTISNP